MKCKTALLLSFISLLLISFQSIGQDVTVSGKVTNKSNDEALPGATVSLKTGGAATQTDLNGMFKLNVPRSGAVLLVTYSGMIDQEIPVSPGVTMYNIQ